VHAAGALDGVDLDAEGTLERQIRSSCPDHESIREPPRDAEAARLEVRHHGSLILFAGSVERVEFGLRQKVMIAGGVKILNVAQESFEALSIAQREADDDVVPVRSIRPPVIRRRGEQWGAGSTLDHPLSDRLCAGTEAKGGQGDPHGSPPGHADSAARGHPFIVNGRSA